MNLKKLIFVSALTVFFSFLFLLQSSISAEALQPGEIITKKKVINKIFNEKTPEGNVDLKKIVEQEMLKPAECDEALVTCQIQEVSFEIIIKKEWLKLSIPALNDYDFANTVPHLKNDISKLTKSELVVLQEVLARRGLLQNLDGSIVKDRGFFGSLTWLGLYRLANIKGLNPKDPKFNNLLRDKVNELLDKMAKDQSYMAKNPLPSREHMTPQAGSPLRNSWDNYVYLARIAQTGKKVNPGSIPLDSNVDVNIDGFVNVERISD